jgi:hypothetical protein
MISLNDIPHGRTYQKREWSPLIETGTPSLPAWLESGAATGTPAFSYEQRAARPYCFKMVPQSTTNNNDAYLRTAADLTPSNHLAIRWRIWGLECSTASGLIQLGMQASGFVSDRGCIYHDRGDATGLGSGSWKTVLQASTASTDDFFPVRLAINTPVSSDPVFSTPKDIALTVFRRKASGDSTFSQFVRIELDESVVYEAEHDAGEMLLTGPIRCFARTINQSSTQSQLWLAGASLEVWS